MHASLPRTSHQRPHCAYKVDETRFHAYVLLCRVTCLVVRRCVGL